MVYQGLDLVKEGPIVVQSLPIHLVKIQQTT